MKRKADPTSSSKGALGYWSAVAIGIGGMVGGGIFAVLGLSVQLARGAAPIAFLVAGLVALITAYSYSRLSVAFPSEGGTVTFIDRAFGSGLLTGTVNILLWLSYIVMLSLYAYAFGSYGASLFPPHSQALWRHVFISGAVLIITALNFLSAELIGRAEDWIVGIKITILLIFAGAGALSIHAARMAPSAWAAPEATVAGGMIIFLAYEGFELIANTAKDVRSPEKTLPRAYYSSVVFVIFLYVLVAAVTVGNLPVAQIVKAKDYALAAAAKPFLGQGGYLMITFAALLSTASAINATLYGTARLSYCIAKDGELPSKLERKIWNEPLEGLLITAAFTLVIANLFDLNSISTMGSTGFLLIFAAVNAAGAKVSNVTGSRRWLGILGTALCLAAMGSLLWQTMITRPAQLWVLAAMVGLSFAIELGYRLLTGRKIHLALP